MTELGRVPGTTIIAGFAIFMFILFLVNTFRSWYRLRHVPGPFWAAFSKFWMVRQSLMGQQPYAIRDANDKYGSLVRIGPNELATNDPDVLRRITAVRSRYSKGPWYNALRVQPGEDNLVSLRDEDAHTKLRKQMGNGYSGKHNESIERTIDIHISRLVDLFETKYLSTHQHYFPVDFAEKIQFFTLDVIGDLAFSETFGYLENDDDIFDVVKIARSFFPVAAVMADIPSLASILHSPLFRSLLPKESDALGFGAFIKAANMRVAERFGSDAISRPDMLGSFIRHGLGKEEASRQALVNVIAGSDTTSTTIRTMMLSLLSHPTAYRQLQKEIDDGISTNRISSPITNAEARALPYLQASILEALRIRPPGSGPFFKTVPPEGDYIDNKFIPGGTQIGVSSMAIYLSENIFGDDASDFVPERWLKADKQQFARMSSVVDLVFSSGKYKCLGQPVALMELNKIFVELLRRFEFASTRPERPANITNAGVWIIEDFPVRITRR